MASLDLSCYAHSLKGRPVEEWQELEQHLRATGDLAERFAQCFAPGWGRPAGLWHDSGKYSQEFQRYIQGNPDAHVRGDIDHSSAGALIAKAKAPFLAFAIAGHHGGMSDRQKLLDRLQDKREFLEKARAGGLPKWIEQTAIPAYPVWLANDKARISLWTRFVFSALVDADFLDTERFYGGPRGFGQLPDLPELKRRLDSFLEKKIRSATPTVMNEMRARVLAACRRSAELNQGAFTLTVPTGGGKTLSSLAFALDHAVKHNLERVIVVIPFTSIIEQTAKEYRDALRTDAIIEHHVNVDPDKETAFNRIASENWDAPIVVTTSVQFFESLYANRPSRCRKLHNIARSVVVFDEVQTFPAHLLEAVRNVLNQLTSHYGVTSLLCTATQPELIKGAREIVPDPAREFGIVAGRCEVIMPASDDAVAWENLADELRTHEQVMAIVHRRDDAQNLAELVGPDCLHLSARMCAEHRSEVLADVKRRLEKHEPCRLVATQLVEAGVDVDFPEVYRSFAGADSLAQAAGRCNREGRGNGRLHVFNATTQPPRGILRTALMRARMMQHEGSLDLKSPATFTRFFQLLYRDAELDSKGVMTAELGQNFAEVAGIFRMIEDDGQESIVAPHGDWESRVNVVREKITRSGMRALQRFIVNLYRQEIEVLKNAGALERVADSFWVVVPGFRIYSKRWGFGWNGEPRIEPESLIA